MQQTSQTYRNIHELERADRQFIVINDKVKEASSLHSITEQLNKGPLKYLKNTPFLPILLPVGGIAGLGALAGIVAAFGIQLGITELLKMKSIDHNTLIINIKEASFLEFPPGHPQKGVFYVAHPVDHKRYYTVAQFHRLTFEHKFSEAISLLMSLGAVTIEVEHVKGWKKEFSSILGVQFPSESGNIDANGSLGIGKTNKESLLFKAILSGSNSPKLPDDLVWYHHEPTWKQVANGRLNHGMKEFTLSVNYEDDFGVNANLESTITSAKFKIGGDFTAHKDTVWRIVGNF